jgi:hypothetical protein
MGGPWMEYHGTSRKAANRAMSELVLGVAVFVIKRKLTID